MDDKLREYWQSNKLMFFFVVIPLGLLFILFALRDLVFSMLAGSAHKAADEAKKADAPLQAQAQAASEDAAKAQQKADDAKKRIDDRKEDDVPDDWFKNK